MTWIFIEPSDVWLFRNGRPFSAGEGHVARSLFPPSPLTVQGALRSLILGHSNVDWSDFRDQNGSAAKTVAEKIGHPLKKDTASPLGSFGMGGPFLACRQQDKITRFTPLPSNVRRVKGTERYVQLIPTRGINFETNWPVHLPNWAPLWSPEEADLGKTEGEPWLSESDLHNYLNNETFAVTERDELFTSEPRFGIGLDYVTGRPEESLLYQAEFIRPNTDVGLLIQLKESFDLPSKTGILQLGGEARAARYREVASSNLNINAGLTEPAQRLKVVFLTPAYFNEGWLPANQDWSPFFGGASVRLVAASIGTPTLVGGWDVARREPKCMRSYVPAGSVYFFESDSPLLPPNEPITETPPDDLDRGRLGFGQIAVGTWDWQTLS